MCPQQLLDLDSLDGESATADFKESFDPSSKQDWCELVKDIVAMTNSGGGCIVIGVSDDGSLSNADIAPVLNVDPADVTNRIYSYTDQHFADFEIIERPRAGRSVVVLNIGPSRIPIVFTAHGAYGAPGGGQKTAFVKGSVYFRHGAKSEPGTTDDLRQALERELELVKEFWLEGIGKVMTAPAGSTVQIVQHDMAIKNSANAAVRLTTGDDAQSVHLENVALRDVPDATAIRLTRDESAPALSVVQADRLYPYRQTELLKKLAERLGKPKAVSGHDLQCVRRVHAIDDDPNFTHQAQYSPRKYSDSFPDWLVERFVADPLFFHEAREACRARGSHQIAQSGP